MIKSNIRKPVSYFIPFFLAMTLANCFAVEPSFAAETIASSESGQKEEKPKSIKTPLRIAVMENNPPFSMVLPNGSPTGLYVDIWKEWSKVTGIEIEFIQKGYSANILDLREGRADFHAGLFINEERDKWADFSIAIDKIDTGLFYRGHDSEKPSLAELNGKLVSAGQGSFQENYIKTNYPKINVYPSVNPQDTINRLLDGNVDALVGEIPFVNAHMAKMGIHGVLSKADSPIFSNTVHALVPHQNKHLVPILNQGIRKLPLDKMIQINKRWLLGYPSYFESLITTNTVNLTIEEQKWLEGNLHLSLGIDSHWKPFEFEHENGEYSGISSEYVSIVENAIGLDLKPEKGNTWAEVIEKAKQGKLDILPGVAASKERESFLSFTEPYASFTNVVVALKSSNIVLNMSDLGGHKIATVNGYNVEAMLRKEFPNIEIVAVKNLEEGIALVEDKTVYGFVDNIAVMTHFINLNNRTDLIVALHTPFSDKLSFGVRKGLEPLVPIINKILATVSQKERNAILNKWLSVQVNIGFDFTTILVWGIPSFTLLFFIIFFVLRINTKLKREVNIRINTENSLKKATFDSEKARTVAENANLSKNQFLANMSHEIRTPMNAIIGTAHLLNETKIDQEQKKLVEILESSSSSLLSLINDILDLSKVEAGKIELEKKKFNIAMLLRNVTKQAEINLHQKDNSNPTKISYQIGTDVPNTIIGDRLRLSQIILNLLGNAVKFTPSGEIKVIVSVEFIKDDFITLHFVVEDSGIGMTGAQMEKLFKTYSQADASTSRKFGGTGLGLSICKKLCQLMQGHIWVESEVDKGSKFHFTCRLTMIEQEKVRSFDKDKLDLDSTATISPEEIDEIVANSRILVVDDNSVNLIIAKKILESKGMQVSSVESGEIALTEITEKKFDCILMDIQMPGIDGYDTTKAIRQGSAQPEIPIIGLSANAMENDIALGKESGMNDYQSKPINPHSLFKSIATQLRNSQ